MNFSRTRILLVISIVLITLGSAAALRADVTGSILGTVHDRSQAVIAGAKIVVTNVENNLSKETTSAVDGSYRILALPVGKYKMVVVAVGFKQFTATDITLEVNDQLHVDATLDVGTVQQEVIISANAVQVETENTQLGDVVDSKKMLALPLNGRSYLDLLGLQAGVVPVTSGSMQQDRPVSGGYSDSVGNLSVNGQRETANAFLVNGGDVSEGRNLGAGLVPNLDSIEEFRLITNSFDAEYGKFSGAVMNAITKSGTNGVHGDAFEFLRNDKFDAKNYFAPSKSELRRNQFGFTAGGPIWKDHIFFFSDYQGTRQVQGAETGLVTVPTVDQRAGNFDPTLFQTTTSMTINGQTYDNVPIPTTVDGPQQGQNGNTSWAQVLSSRLGQQVNAGEAYSMIEVPDATKPWGFSLAPCTNAAQCLFPGGVIPQAAWAKPSANYLPFIPSPTLPGNQSNYSNNSERNIANDDKIGERVDFNNKRTGNWSFYYSFDNSTVDSALPGFASVPGFPTATPSRAQQFVVSNTKTIGTTAVNEARATVF